MAILHTLGGVNRTQEYTLTDRLFATLFSKRFIHKLGYRS